MNAAAFVELFEFVCNSNIPVVSWRAGLSSSEYAMIMTMLLNAEIITKCLRIHAKIAFHMINAYKPQFE